MLQLINRDPLRKRPLISPSAKPPKFILFFKIEAWLSVRDFHIPEGISPSGLAFVPSNC